MTLILIVFNSLTSFGIFSYINNSFISQAQEINSPQSHALSSDVNHTALSLIPLMIKEMQNTNATTIPIKQIINATPSNVTALQNLAKNNVLNNISNNNIFNNSSTINNNPISSNKILNNTSPPKINNFTPTNKTELIPFVVNLTKNTNATEIAIAKTINATPSNVTALQNISKNNILNNISNSLGNTENLAR
ncbi:MAG: hypothetical protein ABJB76_07460 [Candidatus Nitrosocosmicus sp.]